MEHLTSIIGYTAAILGVICIIPKLIDITKTGRPFGMTRLFWYLYLAEKTATFTFGLLLLNFPLIIKYSLGMILILIILFWSKK